MGIETLSPLGGAGVELRRSAAKAFRRERSSGENDNTPDDVDHLKGVEISHRRSEIDSDSYEETRVSTGIVRRRKKDNSESGEQEAA